MLKSINREERGYEKKHNYEKFSSPKYEISSPVDFLKKEQENYPAVEKFSLEPAEKKVPNFGRK